MGRARALRCCDETAQNLVVIDTDPGIDDAVAILTTLGDSAVDVLAITCVRGNAELPDVVSNTLKLLNLAGRLEIDVYAGSKHGLVDSPRGDGYFGPDGFGGLSKFIPSPSNSNLQCEHAASFLARIVEEYPGLVTVMAIGPLTNLALALHLNPQFLKQAKRVVIMGGSVRGYGNVGPDLEFNFHMDPDAAHLVLNRTAESGTIITILPLETALDNDLGLEWRKKELGKIENSVVSFLNTLEGRKYEMHPSSVFNSIDLFTALATLYPEIITQSHLYYGDVENRGEKLRGALAIDYMNTLHRDPNLEVILGVDIFVMRQKMIDNFSTFY